MSREKNKERIKAKSPFCDLTIQEKAGVTEVKKGKTTWSKVICGFHLLIFSSPPQNHWQWRTGLQIMLQMKVKYSCRNSLCKKNKRGKGTAGDEGYFPISLFFYQVHWNTSTTNTSSIMLLLHNAVPGLPELAHRASSKINQSEKAGRSGIRVGHLARHHPSLPELTIALDY